MNLKEGDIVIINGKECPIERGPWKYEDNKKSRNGYGLYVNLMVPYVNKGGTLEWHYRCGIDQLDTFGIIIEEIKFQNKA